MNNWPKTCLIFRSVVCKPPTYGVRKQHRLKNTLCDLYLKVNKKKIIYISQDCVGKIFLL